MEIPVAIRLWLLGAAFVSAFDAENLGDFGDRKFCPPYQCPKGQEPVPRWPLRLESTGCAGGSMFVFSKASPEDDVLIQCCDRRNACHQICGSLRDSCDEEFKKCAKDTCEAISDEEKKKKCNSDLSLQTLLMDMSACNTYDDAQRYACECVSKSKAAETRERVLRAFYKKFNNEGLDKVAGLLAKADTTRKFAGLLQKLVSKYPAAIKRVKDKQQEMMEKMMKETKEKGTSDDTEGDTSSEDENDEDENDRIEL